MATTPLKIEVSLDDFAKNTLIGCVQRGYEEGFKEGRKRSEDSIRHDAKALLPLVTERLNACQLAKATLDYWGGLDEAELKLFTAIEALLSRLTQ